MRMRFFLKMCGSRRALLPRSAAEILLHVLLLCILVAQPAVATHPISASLAVIRSAHRTGGCGTQDPPSGVVEHSHARLQSSMLAMTGTNDTGRAADLLTGSQIAPITIDVWVHVLGTIDTSGNFIYDVTDASIAAQLKVLNDAYKQTGYAQFKLKGTTRTANNAWFYVAKDSPQILAAQRQLRKGDKRTLNIYMTFIAHDPADPPNTFVLGYSSFPYVFNDGITKDELDRDGIVLSGYTVPGYVFPDGETDPEYTGRALVHEVGHWLGLFHPFQGGCSYPNDYVDDTAAQAGPHSGCPFADDAALDSCPSLPGKDVVNNIMDYIDEPCRNKFTSGQVGLMMLASNELRFKVATPTSKPTPRPTLKPTRKPTPKPTRKPTPKPTRKPTRKPASKRSKPTRRPTKKKPVKKGK